MASAAAAATRDDHRRPKSRPTRSSVLRAQYARSQEWPWQTLDFPPSWEFDSPLVSPRRPASARYGENEWIRLATPRTGYARNDTIGPAKKTDKAVWERDQFLREKGYIDNPRELLRMRFHGTSAEQERAQKSARAASQAAKDAASMSVERQRNMLQNCWRSGQPVPQFLLQLAVSGLDLGDAE